MAIDLDPGTSAPNYTHFNTGFNAIVQTPPFTIFAEVNVHQNPGALGSAVYKIDRIPPGFGGNFWYYLLYVNQSMQVAFAAIDFAGPAPAVSPTPIDLNTWHKIAGVAGSYTSRSVYVDGVLGETRTEESHPDPGLEGVLIGASHTSSSTYNRPFNGCLQNIIVWRRALTEEEIASLNDLSGEDLTSLHTTDIVLHVPFSDVATATVAYEYTSGSPLPVTLYQTGSGGSVADCVGPDVPVETGEEPDECGEEDEADARGPCDVEWPKCDLVPETISVDIVPPSVSPGRSFTAVEKVVQPDPGHWRIVFDSIPVKTKARTLLWRQIARELNGRNGTVCVPVYEAKLSGTPIAVTNLSEQPIGATSLDIQQTAGADIRAGMHFSAGEWLYIIKSLTDLGDGVFTASIGPPLREVIEADEALDFNDPRCRCRLATDDAMNLDLTLLRYGSPSVEFREDV